MSKSTCRFNWDELQMPLHEGTMQHVAGVDPSLEWAKRGLKGHDRDPAAAREFTEDIQKASQFLETAEGQSELQDFMEDASSIFMDLSVNSDALENYFPETEFNFVIGPMRTGGTYLVNEMFTMLGEDTFDYNYHMVADGLPTPGYGMFWKRPPNYLSFLFEFSQFLQWVRDVWPSENYVVKKRTVLGHAIPLLNEVFGDRARYLITIRHPGGMAQSSSEYFETWKMDDPTEEGWDKYLENRMGLSTDEWRNMERRERILEYWTAFYRDVGKVDYIDGELVPVLFNRDSENVVTRIANDWGVDHEPEAFEPSNREFDDFWSSDRVSTAIEKVNQTWGQNGREWPELPLT